MRGKTFRGAWLVVALLALAPAMAWGEGPQYAPQDPQYPLPLGSTRPEDGGFYTYAGATLFHMQNPLRAQLVAVRGFRVLDNSVAPTQLPGFPPAPNFPPGTFFGSGARALDVAQLTGADSWLPGFEIGLGWKFKDGSAVEYNWTYFTEATYRAGATLLPKNGQVGDDLSNTFLYADVFNIPPQYSGPDSKINIGGPQAAFGIWNGAAIMTIDFIQRFQQHEIIYRQPIFETETYRLNGLVGPRFAWIWERFRWRTTDIDVNGNSDSQDVAVYTNVVSNRMYGSVAGCEQEYYLGHGFTANLKLQGALFLDSVKEEAKYALQDKHLGLPENKRSRRIWSIVPEAQVTAGMMWYPVEFVQVYAGYEFWQFFNTIASRQPIDTDYANLDPHYAHVSRFFNGMRFNVAITF